MSFIQKLLLLLSLLIIILQSSGNNSTDKPPRKIINEPNGKIRVFVEGIQLDWEFMTKNTGFVDFVREPAASDVHVIINRRASGSGGSVYTMHYKSLSNDNIGDFILSCSTTPVNTRDESRLIIVNTLKMGLMPYVNESKASEGVSIRYRPGQDAQVSEFQDPWRNWTFRGDVTGDLSSEKSRKSYNYSYNIRADKVTHDWKFRNSARLSQRKREYLSGGNTYTSENSTTFVNSSMVKSITNRWSAGAFYSYYNSNYDNTLYSTTIKPAIEYNIFPWDISDRKVFTVAYYIGPEWKKYYQESIFSRMEDAYFEQSLRLNLQIVQTWGEIESTINGTSMVEDISKHRITFNTNLSVRIIKGLSVRFDFRAENIHDQINLPKTEASLEDILLNKVQLPSTFALYSGIGLRLQFGSIYNNIVNNRL
jgi:hypothetical protein